MSSGRATSIHLCAPHVNELRAMLLSLWPSLRWRRHGIGAAQAYVHESDDGAEVRVHVWDPRLTRAGITDRGDIHDHRFRLVSTVLVGAIRHTEYDVAEHPDGAWDVHQVAHARIAPDGRFLNRRIPVVPGPLVATAQRVEAIPYEYTIVSGDWYRFERGAFHRTRVDRTTVTLVRKEQQINAGARVLARHGEPPVPAFDPNDESDPALATLLEGVLVDARERLAETL